MTTEYIAVTGATTAMLKLKVYFTELGSSGPVIAEVGTNPSWSSGVEVKMIKKAIENDYSAYFNWNGQIYIYEASQIHPTMPTHQLSDEYVVNPNTYRKIALVAAKEPQLADQDDEDTGPSYGVSCDPDWIFTVMVQESGAREFIKVPNPLHAGGEHVQCVTLKTWIVRQLALPVGSGGVEDNSLRLFRNDAGKASGDVLYDDDIVWKNRWYYCVISRSEEPIRKEFDTDSPDSAGIGGWNDVHESYSQVAATPTGSEILDGPN